MIALSGEAHLQQGIAQGDRKGSFIPTGAEIKLIKRLRQIGGLCVVDSDAMTLQVCGRLEYLDSRQKA